ncbi:MAG: hypothetical protein WBZ48_08880 [Bacteroidota bacterium]
MADNKRLVENSARDAPSFGGSGWLGSDSAVNDKFLFDGQSHG